MSPSEVPATSAIPTAMIPTCSDTCAPWMIRASSSRPSSSVPIGWAQVGASRRSESCASGSIVQMYLPKTAMNRLKPTIAAPMRPIGLRHFPRNESRWRGIALQCP